MRPADHPIVAVRRFLARATVRGERVVAITRLVLAVLFASNMLVYSVILGDADGLRRFALAGVGFALAAAWSVWTLISLRSTTVRARDLYISVVVDLLAVALTLLPTLLWPTAEYHGLLLMPELAVLIIAIVAAGVRLSRPVALTATVLSVVVLAGGVWLDVQLNAPGYTFQDGVVWAILISGAGLLAVFTASRTTRLVHDGASAAIQAERARQRLGVYVSEAVADEALSSAEILPGGQRQPVAVLFSDLRGFTTYSEQISPERLLSELNAYLDAMVQVVRRHGGVVDKFIGDAIMVVFGVPRAGDEDAARAIRTARDMNIALARHNQERAARGRPPLRHGIGVHFGPAVAGNIGNAERLQYTVVGDVVNTASRLESSTKGMVASVLVSAQAVQAAQGASDLPTLVPVGELQLRGRDATLMTFTFQD